MMALQHRCPCGAPGRTSPLSLLPVLAGGLLIAARVSIAQVPAPSRAQQALPGGALPLAGAQELAAMQALGLGPIQVGGLPVDTGMFQLRGVTPAPPSAVFGVDAFRRTTTQFLPLLSGPVPPDYKLGPG